METPKFANVCEFPIARHTRHISPDLWRAFCFWGDLPKVGAVYQDLPGAAAFFPGRTCDTPLPACERKINPLSPVSPRHPQKPKWGGGSRERPVYYTDLPPPVPTKWGQVFPPGGTPQKLPAFLGVAGVFFCIITGHLCSFLAYNHACFVAHFPFTRIISNLVPVEKSLQCFSIPLSRS